MTTGTKIVLATWVATAVLVLGLFGALRLSAQLTPVRTGARPPVPAGVVRAADTEEVPAAAVSSEATAGAEAAAPTAAARAAPKPDVGPREIWTYKVSKKKYVTVDSYDAIPQEYRATATRMK